MQFERNPCVYMLANGQYGALYIGVTSDLPGRLHQHRTGITKGFTNRYKTYRLVFYEIFDDMPAAIAREKQLKNWRRQWKINLLERQNPHWEDLAERLGFEPLTPPVERNGS